MSSTFQCTITTQLRLINEGTLYLAVLEQLTRENIGVAPEAEVERALSSPESAITRLVLRGAAFRRLEGVRRRGLPLVNITAYPKLMNTRINDEP